MGMLDLSTSQPPVVCLPNHASAGVSVGVTICRREGDVSLRRFPWQTLHLCQVCVSDTTPTVSRRLSPVMMPPHKQSGLLSRALMLRVCVLWINRVIGFSASSSKTNPRKSPPAPWRESDSLASGDRVCPHPDFADLRPR